MATIDPPRAIRIKTSTGWSDLAWKGAQGNTGPPGTPGAQGPQGSAGTGVQYKGVVATSSQLPPTGNQQGDAYTATDTYHFWIWNGINWCDNGPVVFGPTATGDYHRYLGAWNSTTSYLDGDIVIYGGILYQAVRPTTSIPTGWA